MGDFKNILNDFLADNGIWIAIGLCALIVTAIICIFIVTGSKGRGKKSKIIISAWHAALGDKDNIIEATQKGSRLILVLKNYSLIDKDALRDLGVTNFIQGSQKITLVLKDGVGDIAKILLSGE